MNLTPERALIFRITHTKNVPWILDHGIHCQSSDVLDPSFRSIGLQDLIQKRPYREVPIAPGGTLSDYVPFYFTPCSIMLYNIKTGYNGVTQIPMSDIVMLVSSLRTMCDCGIPFVFTDRHAFLNTAEFSNDLEDLGIVDWRILQTRDFASTEDDPGKKERYQAEALVYRHVPLKALHGLACLSEREQRILAREAEKRRLELKIVAKPDWYFE